MAKKKDIIYNPDINQTLDDIMSDRFGRYSKYIIQERALPDARDGLKPVQRRILFAMDQDGNVYQKAHRKSAKTVGLVIGTYHPHGDSSVYEAMVRMSQDWKINLPLIDMHGNNGSIDDDPPAAMRYTEARLSEVASYLLDDIDKETVIMTNNYDDTEVEPTVLPARFPLLLVNGSTGIASGYATNIAPHNFNEVVDATIYRILNPESDLDDLMNFIKGPDFPTGGIVQGLDSLKEIFKTGKGKVVLRSKCEIEEGRTADSIIVSEIPYEVVKSVLVKKISDIYLNKDIEGITDVRDESGRDGLRIVIECKKDANTQAILNYLYKNTDLQINYSYNNIAIVDHRPMLMSLEMMLDIFINHRREVVLNRSIFLRDKKKNQLHIVEGLIKAVSILDSVIETIRKSKDKKDAKDNLIKAFLFTEIQAEAIVNLRLYRLSSTDIQILKEEFATLTREIAELESIISSADVLNNVLVKELKELNEKIVRPRKTAIEKEVEEIVIDKLAMIPNEETYICLSKDGYVKRFSPKAYNANPGQLPFTKDDDYLVGIKHCETLDVLLALTNKGNYLYLPVYKIDECKFKDVGKHISTYIKMENNEKIIGAVTVKRFDTYAYIVTLTKSGQIKKSSLPKWDVLRSSKELTAMKLKKDDEVVSMTLCYDEDDLLVISKEGYYNYYSSRVLSDLACKAQGVTAITLKNDEAAAVLANRHNNDSILLMSDDGLFKRLKFSDLQFTNRASRGSRLFKVLKTRNQTIINARRISPGTSLLINDGDSKTLGISTIAYLSTDSNFSNPLKINVPYSFVQDDLNDIEEVMIVDLPADYQKEEDEPFDQTALFS